MELLNQLEMVIERARNGAVTMEDLLKEFADSDLLVLCRDKVINVKQPLEPLLLAKNDVTMVACFTEIERIGEFALIAPHAEVMAGRDVLQTLPPGMGVVINPGTSLNLEIPPAAVRPFGDTNRAD